MPRNSTRNHLAAWSGGLLTRMEPLHAALAAGATATELSALLVDLKWCFGTPAQTAVELPLKWLGVPALYASMLSDIDVHCARLMATAHGTAVGISEMVHRQLHGTVGHC